jgi:hypothetical protein
MTSDPAVHASVTSNAISCIIVALRFCQGLLLLYFQFYVVRRSVLQTGNGTSAELFDRILHIFCIFQVLSRKRPKNFARKVSFSEALRPSFKL